MTHCFRRVTDASVGSLCFAVPGQDKGGLSANPHQIMLGKGTQFDLCVIV
jgi:hypothetical protein